MKKDLQWMQQSDINFITNNKQEQVLVVANQLMNKHGLGLKGWNFQLDNAKVRAGQCRYDTKTISLSKQFVKHASDHEIRDTVLHEIAHALAPKRGHDSVWRQVALSIGCNGQRCHSLYFSEARYIQKCIRGCWTQEVHRQRKNLICRVCKSNVVYDLKR